jgi:acyl-CoA synthetase (NDP forming)
MTLTSRRRTPLGSVLRPTSIAVIGASETGPTRDVLTNLENFGFQGPVYRVNPHRAEVSGVRTYPSVRDCPGPVGLAIVAVSARNLRAAVLDCAEAAVPGVLIYTSGLAEIGADGARLQAELVEIARTAGTRLLGPNCLGFIDVAGGVAAGILPPVSVPVTLAPGNVGIVSQSGGLMISMLELGSALGIGYSGLWTSGNEADISSLDLLEEVIADEGTRTIGFIAEGLTDGRRFLELATRAATAGKPVVALRLGRSARGKRAAVSHTASIVGSSEVFAAACRQGGVTQVRTPFELVEHLAFFSKRRDTSKRGGVAVVTISGGTKILAADLAEDLGLPLAELAPATRKAIKAAVPDFVTVDNPLDLTPVGGADGSIVRQALTALDGDPAIGTVVLNLHLKRRGASPDHEELVRSFCDIGADATSQFVVISSIPEGLVGFWHDVVLNGPVPFLNDIGSFAVLRSAREFDDARRRLTNEGPPAVVDVADANARLPVPDSGATPMLSEREAYPLLQAAGIDVAAWRAVRTVAEARDAARELGFPVVLKVSSATIAHKSDVGGVQTDLVDEESLETAWGLMTTALRQHGSPFSTMLVQRMADAGVEVLVGTTVSPDFGPVISVGLGGIWAEVLGDVATRLCPVSQDEAVDMLSSLRASPVLHGDRGGGPLAIESLSRTIVAVSRLAARWANTIQEIEVNPVIVSSRSATAVDALVSLRMSTDHVAINTGSGEE